jgi:5-methylcytosine-specific restriction enzyme subunit McrC
MSHLFEFGGWTQVEDPDQLKVFLSKIYDQQRWSAIWNEETSEEEEKSVKQPYLQFDGNSVRANNFCGFIQHGKQLLEIYPKVFRSNNCQDKKLMLQHLFYWLGYCRKWKFPFTNADLNVQTVERFPDMIIYLMVSQIFRTISNQPYHQYTLVEESLQYPRGRINFTRYVSSGLSRGRGHILECDYEPFVFDNTLNRLIKFCLRKLSSQTSLRLNLQLIHQCLNTLDEVEDVPCSLRTVQSIQVNQMLTGYGEVLSLCKYILENQMYDNESYDLNQWCLLFPMEYIFEDFVAGYLGDKFSPGWEVSYQKSDAYLSDDPKVFNMQHDIFLSKGNRKIIIDTKYKIRPETYTTDPKKGIDQGDLYQVVSYAFKRGCNEVFLVYPNIRPSLHPPAAFKVKSGFNPDDIINVTAFEIPFWSVTNFEDIESALYHLFDKRLNGVQ